ncbi:MAG TPA: thiol:disulfide interchange protein DsbA/DsbL [Casimicrobiaceae bacterium]
MMRSMSNGIRRRVVAALGALAALSLVATVHAQGPQEGKEYARIRNPVPVETGKKIEVIEFFSYGCPHCGEFEPVLDGWLKTIPSDVQFRRVPVMFQDRWVPLAKIYYTLEALGEEARLSPEVFTAIHGKGTALWQDKTFFDWAASKGLDRKKVEDMYNSFAIAGKINRAKQQAQAYNVQSVPLIIIDGKFVTASDKVGTHAMLPPVMDALIAKARAERPKS